MAIANAIQGVTEPKTQEQTRTSQEYLATPSSLFTLACIPSHRATTVRSKPQMAAERGREIQRQPLPAKAFRRTLSRIG